MFPVLLWFSWILLYTWQIYADGNAGSEDERIVGGRIANAFEYPFMANLILRNKEGGKEMCGGSLINSQFILTAAHCLKKKNGEEAVGISVKLGIHNMRDEQNEPLIVKREVETWFYKNYDQSTMANDVALLKLQQPVTFTKAVKPISVPPTGHHYPEGSVRAIGWGATNDVTYDLAKELQEIDLSVLPDSSCFDSYKTYYKPDVMICAGFHNDTKDTCSGDSGGPLFITDTKGQPTVIALTSFAKNGCGRLGYFAVYTKVASFTAWITSRAALGGPVCIGTF